MKREELIAMGISEENIEKIMADYGSSIQRANAKAEQYKTKADRADELQIQLDELNSQSLSDVEKANKALETANNRIAELEKRDVIRTKRSDAMEKFGITAEQANKVVTDDGVTDYEVLGQIFADGKKIAVAEYEKQILNNTPNPDGKKEKNESDKVAERIGKNLARANDVTKTVVESYL